MPGGMPNAGAAARSGPGPKGGGRDFGGAITGRMNLLAPAETGVYAAEPFAAPAPPPAPMFAPERIETLDPAIVNQLKLPLLTPNAVARPTSPQSGPQAPTIEAGLPSPAVVAPAVKQPLRLSAAFDEKGASIRSGLKWRLFTDQADRNGEHMLVAESTDAAPRFDVDPGSYIVHAVYGLVSAAKFVTVKAAQPAQQTIVLSAGAVRLTAFAGGAPAPEGAVTFKLTRDEGGMARVAAGSVRPGQLLRLPAGDYHVASSYGDANATVEADIKIAPGKLVEAQVHHKAARVSLKLVERPGGPELQDTSWTIMTPGGDVIRDSIGALSGVVLMEGDYTVIARREGRLYQQSFDVRAGVDESVEVRAN